jgi:hypothetical protein
VAARRSAFLSQSSRPGSVARRSAGSARVE